MVEGLNMPRVWRLAPILDMKRFECNDVAAVGSGAARRQSLPVAFVLFCSNVFLPFA